MIPRPSNPDQVQSSGNTRIRRITLVSHLDKFGTDRGEFRKCKFDSTRFEAPRHSFHILLVILDREWKHGWNFFAHYLQVISI